MPISLLMPALSPTMTEGNLVKWHKKEGDAVKAGQVLAEIETDKATMEVEAVDEGVLGRILVAEGTENVKVNQIIAVILEDGEDASEIDGYLAAKGASAQPQAQAQAQEQEQSQPQTQQEPASAQIELPSCRIPPVTQSSPPPAPYAAAPTGEPSSGRIFATPLAKRIALEAGFDLRTVSGSGPRGRIIRSDVESALASGTGAKSGAKTAYAMPAHGLPAFAAGSGLCQDIALNGMRKTIAKRLTQAKQEIPHFYLSVDLEIGKMLMLRKEYNEFSPAKVSVNDCVIRACALALREVPDLNVTFHDAYVRSYEDADISVAVAIDGGLVTPIVKAANLKTVAVIGQEVKELAARAKGGKLKPEEYQGGSFTVSNLGMYGIDRFNAIINPPQAAILAVGAGKERAVIKDGTVQAATVMTCTLSVDHRAADGAVAAQFLQALTAIIEHPLRLFV